MAGESSRPVPSASNFGTAEIRSEKLLGDRRRKFFRAVAKHAFPKDTVRKVRRLTRDRNGQDKYGVRTIYDWLDGRSDAPIAVYISIMADVLRE